MSSEKLKNAVAGAAGTALAKSKEPMTFPQWLQSYKSELQLALPKHLNVDRMARIALTCFRQNPDLEKCDPRSVFAAVMMGAQLGLEPGIMGQAYLVPYKDRRRNTMTCQFIPGWQGLVDLVSRAGRASVWTGAVFHGDNFDFELGDRPFIRHRPEGEDDVNKLIYLYAVGRVNGSEWPVIEVWKPEKVARHRNRFNKVGDGHYSYNNFEMYGRKIPLLQVLKYMPKSVELHTSAQLSHAADRGDQGLDLSQVIEGSWSAPADPADSDAGDGDGAGSGGDSGPKGAPDPQFTKESAVARIREQKDAASVDAVFEIVKKDFAVTNRELPVEIEGARTDRLEALKKL